MTFCPLFGFVEATAYRTNVFKYLLITSQSDAEREWELFGGSNISSENLGYFPLDYIITKIFKLYSTIILTTLRMIIISSSFSWSLYIIKGLKILITLI